MDNLDTVLNKDYYMAITDLADAPCAVPALCINQKYLLFQFKGNCYKYTCFPDVLASAPIIFTKILKPMFSALAKESQQIMC